MKGKIVINKTTSENTEHSNDKFSNLGNQKYTILKNVIVISIAFMLQFTAFKSMSVLQSSINNVDGLGTWSNTAIYGALLVSSLFLPSYIIQKLSVKWTIPICMFCYSIYIATQFYPTFYTIIPSGILVGIAAAPLWSAKCIYLTRLGEIYAEILTSEVEPILVRFFGIFFFVFRCSDVLGLLISSLILRKEKGITIIEPNVTLCGINYCPDSTVQEENFEASDSQLYALSGTYLGSSLVACLFVAILLDSLSKVERNCMTLKQEKKETNSFQLIMATFKHISTPYQILITPITIWSGLSQGFIISDFTAGFISCIFGVGEVGLVLIAYGVSSAMGSLSLGVIAKHTGRLPLYVLAATFNLTVIITLMNWIPQHHEKWVLFLLSGISGGADAIWNTQNFSFYGVLFADNKTAAYASYRLWDSIGYLIAFILQTQLCIGSKLYILLIVLAVGLIGYLCIELNERKLKKTEKAPPKSKEEPMKL